MVDSIERLSQVQEKDSKGITFIQFHVDIVQEFCQTSARGASLPETWLAFI